LRRDQGHLDESLEDLRRALTAKEKAGGPETPDVALSINNISLVLVEMGDLEQALVYIDRAADIMERRLGPNHFSTGVMLSNRAEILNALGRFQEAQKGAQRALAILAVETDPEGMGVSFPITALGIAHLELGDVDPALRLLEKAVAIRDGNDCGAAQLGEVHFALARALRAAGLEPSRARALAERAREDYGKAAPGPATTRRLDHIEAWLGQAMPR
jgi:tetratricopeptide (TPR) repeat protein